MSQLVIMAGQVASAMMHSGYSAYVFTSRQVSIICSFTISKYQERPIILYVYEPSSFNNLQFYNNAV